MPSLFLLCGRSQAGRRAGLTGLKNSHPDLTQERLWGWRGVGGGLTCSPRLAGWSVGTDSTSASCLPAISHQKTGRGIPSPREPDLLLGNRLWDTLWNVSKRLPHHFPCTHLKRRFSGPYQAQPAQHTPWRLCWSSPLLPQPRVSSLGQEGVNSEWGPHPWEGKGPHTQATGSTLITRARGYGGGSHQRIGSEDKEACTEGGRVCTGLPLSPLTGIRQAFSLTVTHSTPG